MRSTFLAIPRSGARRPATSTRKAISVSGASLSPSGLCRQVKLSMRLPPALRRLSFGESAASSKPPRCVSVNGPASLAAPRADTSPPSRPSLAVKKKRAMPSVELRKRITLVEDIFHEGGPVARSPYRRAAILSVIKNPFAGRYVEDIVGFPDDLKPLGLDMANALIAALGGDPKTIQGYGKGAIVGAAGEIEHGALWHVPGGYAMREALGGAMAIVPSAKKIAGPGTRLDVPITHINAAYVRSHFDAIEVGVADAPRADEILLALAMTAGPRVHNRAGGLEASQIKGMDGLR